MAEQVEPERRSVLAEVLLDVEVRVESDHSFEVLHTTLARAVKDAVAAAFGPGHTAVVETEEGSFLGKVTLLGAMFIGTQTFIAQYPDMKAGLREMLEDAQQLRTGISERFREFTGLPAGKTEVSVRPAAPKAMLVALDLVAAIRRREMESDPGQVARLREQLREQLSVLLRSLSSDQVEELIRQITALGPTFQDDLVHAQLRAQRLPSLRPRHYGQREFKSGDRFRYGDPEHVRPAPPARRNRTTVIEV